VHSKDKTFPHQGDPCQRFILSSFRESNHILTTNSIVTNTATAETVLKSASHSAFEDASGSQIQ